ncbi:MAG: hypothetical protein ACR2OU_03530 [Thermomicrobiales bacterium]
MLTAIAIRQRSNLAERFAGIRSSIEVALRSMVRRSSAVEWRVDTAVVLNRVHVLGAILARAHSFADSNTI